MQKPGLTARRYFLAVCLSLVFCLPANADPDAFHAFLESLWPRASAQGISRVTFAEALDGLSEDPSVPVAVAKQPEFERLLSAYFKEAVSPTRIARGRALAETYHRELDAVISHYGVPRGILLAAWGMESDFGRDRGNKDVVRSLATLAFHRRDNDLFANEFLSALVILQKGQLVRARLVGSWAGAMGDPQFMPSAYLKYAVTYRGAGVPDIWNSPVDTLASIGHFLRASGWNPALPWGMEVVLPKAFGFKTLHADFRTFAAEGVRAANGTPLPHGNATLFLPAGAGGPAFLLSDNYWIIKFYNNSDSYALSLACLGDRIEGRSGLRQTWPQHQKLWRRTEKIEIQHLLTKLGFYHGTYDGKFGQASRAAIHAFQIEAHDAPADGIGGANLLGLLRAKASAK